MTLPNQEVHSIAAAHEFLRDLLDPKKTPKVPKDVRERARMILKHHPSPLQFLGMLNALLSLEWNAKEYERAAIDSAELHTKKSQREWDKSLVIKSKPEGLVRVNLDDKS